VTYRTAKHRIICWTRAALFELAVAQIVVGVGLWAWAVIRRFDEPAIVLAMSALALIFSGLCTAAVAAIDEGNGNS
jgi:hypothetical protein